MALAFNRTIESPGVEIRELDYSLYTRNLVGTNVMAMGFAKQGPIDELINVTSMSEFEMIYGRPTNAAERYFYHTAKEIMLKNGNLVATRLPYGKKDGEGYGSEYSVLAYPATLYTNKYANFSVTYTAVSTFDSNDADLATYYNASAGSSYFNSFTASAITGVSSMGGVTGNYTGLTAGDVYNAYLSGGTIEWENMPFDLTVKSYTVSAESSTGANKTDVYKTLKMSGIAWGDEQYTNAIAGTSGIDVQTVKLGTPKQIIIDEKDYQNLIHGNFMWANTLTDLVSSSNKFTDLDSLSGAALIVLNKVRSTTNEIAEGSYIIMGTNKTIGYGTDYDTVHSFQTLTNDNSACTWSMVKPTSLNFELTGQYRMSSGTTSEIIESIPSWDITPSKYNDTIVLAVMKLRKSIYNNSGIQQIVLDQVLTESYVGSLNANRQEVPPRGTTPESFFIEDVVNSSSNTIQVVVNPLISQGINWNNGKAPNPKNKVDTVEVTKDVVIDNDSMSGFAIGPYVPVYSKNQAKIIGNLWGKIERALRLAENIDYVPLDILVEGGLGTISVFNAVANEIKNTSTGKNSGYHKLYKNWDGGYYEDIYLPGILEGNVVDPGQYLPDDTNYRYEKPDKANPNINDSDGITKPLMAAEYGPNQTGGRDSFIANEYQAVFEIFREFVEFTRRPGTLFIADPVRHIFVQGNKLVSECRVWDDEDGEMVNVNFPQHIYWPLKNLYAETSTSYACTYANWVKVADTESSEFHWMPFSGFAAGIMCDVDRTYFPWFAPAGLNRGRIGGIVEIGYNTTQKQRDLLYRSSINPVVFFPQDGFVVWGQKTLLKTPSAFDRINVRRLFLVLEKATLAVARYFVFEQNTIFTRTRLVDTLRPIFERAKNNEGLYDYMIVCDERNNTPDTIDNNELIVDIYLKPVKTAEFILISFIATRTGQEFSELI